MVLYCIVIPFHKKKSSFSPGLLDKDDYPSPETSRTYVKMNSVPVHAPLKCLNGLSKVKENVPHWREEQRYTT